MVRVVSYRYMSTLNPFALVPTYSVFPAKMVVLHGLPLGHGLSWFGLTCTFLQPPPENDICTREVRNVTNPRADHSLTPMPDM